MSNTPEEFEKLQKLLKLKRHEVPPPGYFNNFSTRVITGIERHEHSTTRAFAYAPWLGRFMTLLETNPFVSGIFGVSVCGLLVSGIAWSQYGTPVDFASNSNPTLTVADNQPNATLPALSKAENVDSMSTSSLSPVFAANGPSGLFTGLSGVVAEPVNFSVAH
jgi:hypothetical protein